MSVLNEDFFCFFPLVEEAVINVVKKNLKHLKQQKITSYITKQGKIQQNYKLFPFAGLLV